jgi:hypothetical protein
MAYDAGDDVVAFAQRRRACVKRLGPHIGAEIGEKASIAGTGDFRRHTCRW